MADKAPCSQWNPIGTSSELLSHKVICMKPSMDDMSLTLHV